MPVGRATSLTFQMQPECGGELCGGFLGLKRAQNCGNLSETKFVKNIRSQIRHSFFFENFGKMQGVPARWGGGVPGSWYSHAA